MHTCQTACLSFHWTLNPAHGGGKHAVLAIYRHDSSANELVNEPTVFVSCKLSRKNDATDGGRGSIELTV